jgi:glutathione S-transferase
VPLLVDPNTKSYCFESGAIQNYLEHQYGPADE